MEAEGAVACEPANDSGRADDLAIRYRYPRSHRDKYLGHEFVKVCGIAVRKLSPREIAELQRAVDAGPVKPIRLEVDA
jgi:hypothetical protein